VLETGERLEGREELVRLDLDGTGNLRETYWNYAYLPVRYHADNVKGVMAFSLDVTDQVLARRRVEESEDKFRRLVAQVEAGIAQTDLSGRFVFINERYREIVGRSESELLQLRMQDITHQDDLDVNIERFTRLVDDGLPFVLEKRYVKPDGTIVWVQNSVSRIDGADGTPQGTAAVTLDVTERMIAERARQESEERFRNMADNSPVMVWVTEPDGSCSYLSKSWYDFTGQTPDTGLGFGWLAAVHPEDAKGAQDVFVAANARGEGFRLEYRLRDRDGVYRYAIDSAAPRLGASGEFLGFIGSVIDIDERRMIEDRLAALQALTARLVDAASAEEVADVAISGSAVVVGAAAGVFYRLPEPTGPALLVAQQGFHIHARPALELDAALPLAAAIREARTVWLASQATLAEYPEIDKSAAKIKAVVALPVLVEKTVVGGFALSFEREHALGRANREFLESVAALCAQALLRISAIERERQAREATRKEMERAVRFSELFVGILGHDLRNPLSAITTAAHLLETRADSEKVSKPAARIVASADRMERMISQLLDFTRIRLGRGLPLDCARVDLGELARTIIEETEPVYRREIQLHTQGDLHGMWDRDRLSQLLSNLAANACQHGTRDCPIVIEIDGAQRDVVQLEVRNKGVVPHELLPVVFEPLRHSGERQSKREGSSGLGLGL
ncbi:MAG TPA: PAS domain S-box protein, partial [Polyangiales bacterium]|nr:PAS domain S-box protein [Polyangiales bacterium]